MAFIDTIRAAQDNGVGIIAFKEMSNYKVFLVTVTNDQTNYDDTSASRIRTNTRLTVGSGVASNLNPQIQYIQKRDLNQTSILSGGALTEMELMIGPIAFPYNTGYQSGGIDPAVFQPGPTSNKNTSIYIQLTGFGMNQANGNYFKIKEIVLNGMDNVFYYVQIVAIEDVIPA